MVTGTVTDSFTGNGIPGVNLIIKGTSTGTVTDAAGNYSLPATPPFTLVASFVGYSRQEKVVTSASGGPLNFALKESSVLADEVVVSASRIEESITRAGVTIEKMGLRQLQQTAAATPFDALQNLKGVDLLTQSLTFKSVNVRGFGANNNNRFLQLTDGMDNRSPGLGFGFGNVAGVSDLDIESIELLPGAASALYGPDALQGLQLTTSKNPFQYQGLSVQLKAGVNNVGKAGFGPKPYTDVAIRYAKQLGERFAFKVNFQTLNGTDFIADDYNDRSHRDRAPFVVNQSDRSVALGYVPNSNPATNLQYDGVNIYGDDFNNGGAFDYTAANTTNAALVGKRVTRTGYKEIDLTGNNGKVFSTRANVSLFYKLSQKVQASLGWYYGNGNFIRTGGFREYFPDYKRNQFRAEVKGDNFFVRAYSTSQTAEGYNLGNLARRLLQIARPTAAWASDFAKAYTGDNILAAKQTADAGIFVPGSSDFNRYRDELINTPNNLPIPSAASLPNAAGLNGVRLLDNSSMYHAEGMYNFNKVLPRFLDIITGASFRRYSMLTEGTIFPTKKDGSEFKFNEYGWYLQGIATLKINDLITFKPTVAVRYDKNQFFKGGFTPRVSGVLSVGEHNFRASWQSAFRNPSPNQLLSDGKTGEVGGSQEAVTAADLYNNPAYTPASVSAYQKSGNVADLVKYVPDPSAFGTEKIKTWEVGYKTLVANRLFVDAFLFHSKYTDFIAAQNYLQPNTGNVEELKNVSTTRSYQINFNNTNEIFVDGWGLGVEYGLGRGFTLSGNFAHQVGKITRRNNFGVIQKDAFGQDIINRKMSDLDVAFSGRNFFISPENRYNVSLANPRVNGSNFGFNVTYRWTDKMWVEQGTTAGDIVLPSWNTVDAQVSMKVPTIKSTVKLGGANIFNKYYSQGYGLAQIGGLYYISLTFDELMR